ncbi:ABC transporter substrate-binding protein [Peterkaempfera bronchialis]|uniref:Sugar ABC transporter substrate-binding protein n=1 Tax=Peterkaempfera bronchialis TaxID=2126346 RepID=A0A345SSU8_9ACTN|nr:sugar ABC transporter substrate-binding protein [Peterkaempfera bronchialis]AXI76803.1 sugar ABC transporter substrate-binding protein [Peterkaempfera bronchialis]
MNATSRRSVALLAAAALAGLAGCAHSSGSSSPDGKVTLNYALWDDKQLPAYQACADAFTQQNPDISVKITQTAWGDYWQNLTTELAAGDAPDVFTDHVGYYPKLAASGQLLDLQPLVDRDKVDLGRYQQGLADLWVKDGKRYGLPKDWDTMALIYNSDMLKKAGVDPASLKDLTWNPQDGGTFEQLIAKLTVDSKGHNGLDPAFDRNNVAVFGYQPDYDSGGAPGQSSFGNFVASMGFEFTDQNPFGTKFHYDDPKLAQTIDWLASLSAKGYSPKLDKTSTLGTDAVLNAGKAALGITGSWNINTYLGPTAKQKFAFAELPIGPAGRKSMINGLSDAVFAGTKHQDEAWKWAKFLASPACQDTVGENAVVFPAITSASDKALAAHQAAGQDVSAFVDEAHAPGGTFFWPITDHGDEIAAAVKDAVFRVYLGQSAAAPALADLQKQVDALFAQG